GIQVELRHTTGQTGLLALRIGDGVVEAGLPGVATALVLVAVVNHDVEAVAVTGLQPQAAQVPAHLRTVTLIRQTSRGGVGASSQVPVVLRRIGGGDDRHGWRRSSIIYLTGERFPGAEDGIGSNRGPAPLPVAAAVVRIGGRVADEQRRRH